MLLVLYLVYLLVELELQRMKIHENTYVITQLIYFVIEQPTIGYFTIEHSDLIFLKYYFLTLEIEYKI